MSRFGIGRRIASVIGGLGLCAGTVAVPVALDVTVAGAGAAPPPVVEVSPGSMGDWTEVLQDSGDGRFEPGPDTAPLGDGSYEMSAGPNSDPGTLGGRVWMRNTTYGLVSPSDITEFTYNTYTEDTTAGDQVTVAVEFPVFGAVRDDGDPSGFTTLVFEPTYDVAAQGPVASGVWQEWDALRSGIDTAGDAIWWTSRTIAGCTVPAPDCFLSWDDLVTNNPDMIISPETGIQFAIGQNAENPPWDGFVGNLDDATIGVDFVSTTFDFEPAGLLVDDDGMAAPGDCEATDVVYDSIQDAIDGSPEASTITVCPGTYPEQLHIDKDITVLGSGEDTTIVTAPSGAVVGSCPGTVYKAFVEVCDGADAALSGLTFTGPFDNGVGPNSAGIFVMGEASLDLSASTVDFVQASTGHNGTQTGIGILVGRGSTGEVGHADIDDVDVTAYNKGGVVFDGAGTTGSITNSTVTGEGEQDKTAQNGIQVSRDAVVSIEGNTVSGNLCNHSTCGPDGFFSFGILLFDSGAGTEVIGNEVDDNDGGLYHLAPGVTTTVDENTFSGGRWVGAFLDMGMVDMDSNTVTENRAPDLFQGSDPEFEAIGLWVVAFGPFGSDEDDSNLFARRTTITGNDIGVQMDDFDPDDDIFSVVDLRNGSIVGNDYGMYNNTIIPQNAFANFNWWGDSAGPEDWGIGEGDKVGPEVSMFPWLLSEGGLFVMCNQTGSLLIGTPADDILCGTVGKDEIRGAGGNDLILGQGLGDRLFGGDGDDVIWGAANPDEVYGGAGYDYLQGGGAHDICLTQVDGGETSRCEVVD